MLYIPELLLDLEFYAEMYLEFENSKNLIYCDSNH